MQPEASFANKVTLSLAVDATKQAAALAAGNTLQIHFLNKTTRSEAETWLGQQLERTARTDCTILSCFLSVTDHASCMPA